MKFAVAGFLFAAVLCTSAQAHSSPLPYSCTPDTKGLSYENVDALSRTIVGELETALGKDWVDQSEKKVAGKRVAPEVMSRIAALAGCAAELDVKSSCAMFYDPEFSTTLGVFTGLPRKARARTQFDAAINALASEKQKAAAQQCMKLVARK